MTSTKRPEATCAPGMRIRNTPPGRGSISPSTPCQDVHRSTSVKNENTVAGDAAM